MRWRPLACVAWRAGALARAPTHVQLAGIAAPPRALRGKATRVALFVSVCHAHATRPRSLFWWTKKTGVNKPCTVAGSQRDGGTRLMADLAGIPAYSNRMLEQRRPALRFSHRVPPSEPGVGTSACFHRATADSWTLCGPTALWTVRHPLRPFPARPQSLGNRNRSPPCRRSRRRLNREAS